MPGAEPAEVPAVTVVIPTRGRPELVREAVEGVVAQTYAGPVHCIVVHDQEAPDQSLCELATAGRTVTVLRNEGTTGLSGSRNFGLRGVTDDFVASCDDDDRWLPDKLDRQMRRLLGDPALWVVGAGIRLLMRREVFDRVGGYDERLPQSYAEDYEWLLRASRLGPVGVVREPLAEINKASQSWFRERNEVVSEALRYVLAHHPEIAASRAGHARIMGQIAFAEASLGHRREAMRWAGRSLARWPFAPQAVLAMIQVVFAFDPRTLLRYARLAGRGLA